MYVAQRQRFRATICDVQLLLEGMALDARAFPGVASESRPRSTASSPSLRSRESEVITMGRSTPENGGGNVRVVVRVRGFLPRGIYMLS